MSIDTSLTPTELDRLDDFLTREDAPENAMNTSMLYGYLAAVASDPDLVMPDHMLCWVLDTENGGRNTASVIAEEMAV